MKQKFFAMIAAISTCSDKNNTSAAVANASWMLASRSQWETMGATFGYENYSALRDGFSSVGGVNLQSDAYWSSSQTESGLGLCYNFYDGD